uniref:uncharacterized protein topaz1 isoform X2 n=1 Tax=Scatophagus argus TaxID=75038 RepID=UPI001ED84E9C|nr:uncharacterized protein topaz1 isoform X2 [Scatophagus argus]
MGGRDRGKVREGQSKVTAVSTGWNPQPAAANTGHVPTGTRSIAIGLSNTDRNTYPSPTALTGSEGSLRRAVRPSSCGFWGHCEYVSPQQKALGKQGQKCCSPGQDQRMVEVQIKEENQATEASQKITIWTGQYPKVTLCDIAQKCDAICQDSGYMLPDVLKTKVVHCFKQDMTAGFQFAPDCLTHNGHKSEDCAVAKSKQFCPRVQSKKSICRSQSLIEHQRHLKERTNAQMLPSHAACRFHKTWTSEGCATCSASFLLGKRAKMWDCRTDAWDRNVEEDPGLGSHITGVEIHTDKKIKLGNGVKDERWPSTPHLKCSPAKTDSRDQEKTCFWMSDDSQSCSQHAVGGCSTFGSAVKENSVHKKPCSELDSSTKANEKQMSLEPFCQETNITTDELGSFTCQRVRVYLRKNTFSCARTYMSWPFSDSSCTKGPSDNGDSSINQNQPGTPSSPTNDALPNAPTGLSLNTTYQVSHRNDKDGKSFLAERNGDISSYSPDYTNMEFTPHLMENEETLVCLPSDKATLCSPSHCGRDPGADVASSSSLPVNETLGNSSTSTPSLSVSGLSDWETATTLSSVSSPLTYNGLRSLSATLSALPSSLYLQDKSGEAADESSPSCMIRTVEKPLLYYEDTRKFSCTFSSSSPHNSDSFQSCDSSLLLPQEEQESDKALLVSRCPPKLEPYYNTNPINVERSLHNILIEKSVESEFILPPMLSPVPSPQRHSRTSPLRRCLVKEEEEINTDACKHKMLAGCRMPQIANDNIENSMDYLGRGREELDGVSTNLKPQTVAHNPQPCSSSDEDMDDGNEEESQDETDCENAVEQGNKKSEQVSPDPNVKAAFTSGVLTEPRSSPSSDEDEGGAFIDEGWLCSVGDEGSSPSDITDSERDLAKTEAAGDTQQGILDEFTAYEQDILLVDVIQDDPELFENLPKESLLKLGPTRVTDALKTGPLGVVKIGGATRLTPVTVNFLCDSPEITEKSNRPWRPYCSSTPSKAQRNTCPAAEKQTKNMGQPDANNNHVSEVERNQPIKTVNSLHNHIIPLVTKKNGPWVTNPANMADFRHQKSNAYCRQYFSESLSCGFKKCRFQHVPVEGDEKFCVETVTRFIKNPMCLQKAGAVFTGYYHNNPPGVYFSMPVLMSLLWALLKAGMVPDVFSVLSVSLAHKIVPSHEFLLALFNFVREKRLMSFVPELMQLTFKMASAGLVLSLDSLDCVKNSPEVQHTVFPNSASGSHKLPSSAPFPEYLNLAQSVVEIELCTKQEDWRRMGEVFRSIGQSSQRPNHVEQISGRIAIALLSESKDKLSLPFAAFSETVCQNEGDNSLVRNFFGRIGVSLMLRYHKTHQWVKGRRVVEVLSGSKVNYSTLKGLFGNEDRASRCCLITVATELFLLSGSVEGALNTLRENKWFLSSGSWPCEPADLESRTRVLLRLAEKSSHRDTLEVLCNLPGIKEPNDLVDISRYCPLFNSHLQVCVDRQILPVASDTVDFMLSNNLAVNHSMLQILLNKLGKQNLWLRAREIFRHSLNVGYYPDVSAPAGFMTLIVPCRLGEVELALAFEMFITFNAAVIVQSTTCGLSITLKRTQSCESKYLSASSRLLAAACIPQPKLIISYKAVNSSQEQVFTLDISSARCWLRHNHLWANEVWTY